jgi:hypothetical protein
MSWAPPTSPPVGAMKPHRTPARPAGGGAGAGRGAQRPRGKVHRRRLHGGVRRGGVPCLLFASRVPSNRELLMFDWYSLYLLALVGLWSLLFWAVGWIRRRLLRRKIEPVKQPTLAPLVAGSISMAVGASLAVVSLWDEVRVEGLIGALVFVGIGILGVLRWRQRLRSSSQ